MKLITLTASEVVDGNKVELGRLENFPVPETVDEVIAMSDRDDGCNDDEIVSCFNYGWKVKSQAKLRSGSDPKSPSTVFKKASREKQDAILKLAKEKGLL
jgi:hypothetical protein